jgi:hypothetical protein
MPALAAIALVWLGAEKPDARAKTVLDGWAVRHGIQFDEPAAEPAPTDTGAEALGKNSEQALEQARDQLTAGDPRAARLTLARLEQTLREHPELLESSWIMAERCRLEAQIGRSVGDDAAASWDARADALEGPRAPAFGASDEPSAAPPPIAVRVAVRGARRFEVYWDGARAADRIDTTPGEHHVVVVRGNRVGWSGWVTAIRPGPIEVWVRDAPPCSAEDLAGVSARAPAGETGGSTIPTGIRCARWGIAAKGLAPDTVRIAVCRNDGCSPFETEAYRETANPAPATRPEEARGLPSWALWTLAGVGAAMLTTSVVLWRAGVFDRAEPTTKVVYDGSKL